MVHMSSWFDAYSRTATDNYVGLRKRKRGPVRLVMGPWTHGDRQLTYVGDVDFGPNSTLDGNVATDFLTLRLRWFDRWLKGLKNGVEAEPPVRIFIMGGGTGRELRGSFGSRRSLAHRAGLAYSGHGLDAVLLPARWVVGDDEA